MCNCICSSFSPLSFPSMFQMLLFPYGYSERPQIDIFQTILFISPSLSLPKPSNLHPLQYYSKHSSKAQLTGQVKTFISKFIPSFLTLHLPLRFDQWSPSSCSTLSDSALPLFGWVAKASTLPCEGALPSHFVYLAMVVSRHYAPVLRLYYATHFPRTEHLRI